MGIFDRLTGGGAGLAGALTSEPKASFGPSSSFGDPNHWIVRALGGGKTDSGVAVSEWIALTLPVVYSCVSIIADNVAQLPLNVYRALPGGGRELVTDHPLQALLHDSPNEDMSSFVWRQTKQHHALLWGNGYSEIERTRGGDPVAILPLYPDRTEPVKEPGKELYFRSSVDGRSVKLNPADVLHIPAMGFDGFRGISPVQVAREGIGMGLAMQKFGGKFFANDAKSGGFLMHPGKLGDPGTNNIRESFTKQGGNENAFKVKVLEEGMKFVSTTIPPDDAQFLSSREFQVAEIARIYRVPLVLLQSMEKTSSWGSGIEQMMIGFVVWTIQPWIVRWEQELNRKLLSEQERRAGYFIKFNLNGLLRGDMKARGQFYKDLYGIGALNPNEIRELEDRNPYEGGEEFRVPLNMVDPLDDPEDDPNAAESGGDPDPDDDAPPPEDPDEPAPRRDRDRERKERN